MPLYLVSQQRVPTSKGGLTTRDEMNVDCCYALRDKVWITDPDGNRWEVFTVKVSDTKPELKITEERMDTSQPSSCCRTKHRLPPRRKRINRVGADLRVGPLRKGAHAGAPLRPDDCMRRRNKSTSVGCRAL